VLRRLGPEVLGFLTGAIGTIDADDLFATLSERLWSSLRGFEGRCSVRTWFYVLARHEIGRFRRGARAAHDKAGRRVAISAVQDVLAAARTTHAGRTEQCNQLIRLRDELPMDDRMLLILRVDRDLSWEEIALAFAAAPEQLSGDDRRREAARLRKRFQLVRQRLLLRARAQASATI